MYGFSVGVLLESFRASPQQALCTAAEMGIAGVQVHAAQGYFDIDSITPQKVKDLRRWLGQYGLGLPALCGDFICITPGLHFSDPSKSEYIFEKSKRILDFAKEAGTNIVTTHVGVVPSDQSCDKFKVIQQLCRRLAEYAGSMDGYFAIETGPETAVTLKCLLDSLGIKGVGVNLDPANLVMVTGDDPVQAVYTLRDYILHTHAKDGRMLLRGDPEIIYGEIETQIQAMKYFIETPLGEGNVPFADYLKALDEIGYKGYLTIEREVGENPQADIEKAVQFLRKQIAK